MRNRQDAIEREREGHREPTFFFFFLRANKSSSALALVALEADGVVGGARRFSPPFLVVIISKIEAVINR